MVAACREAGLDDKGAELIRLGENAFVAAYGRDLCDWHRYETLRGLQEFGMTTWLMQNIQEDEETAAEYRRRIAGPRNDDAPRDWKPW